MIFHGADTQKKKCRWMNSQLLIYQGNNMKSEKVICNTSPIIGLLSIGRLSLLWELFDEIILPDAVFRELCAGSSVHQKEIIEIKEYVSKGYLKIYKVKNAAMVKSMYGKLHFGELEVIVATKELGLHLAIIDEKAARKMASEFLIDTIGILGILILAKQNQLLSCVKPDIDKLRMNGYRISDELYEQLLEKAGENNE
ncbi:DUF3368 domain-containing protein [Schaedlerella arabinosiphila]|uniref:DUF3368 domain-containing protein n=2 Tax=Schaedlerella arabinosiphila TaxID=2044587 RepID=A0A9X5H7L3_9FIRM|nr:DUF3368 domain-containing protein [Schaedlerella arabinosiphila]